MNNIQTVEEYTTHISNFTFTDSVQDTIDMYYTLDAGNRDKFVWKWIGRVIEELTVVNSQTAKEEKLLLSIFITTIDDIGEIEGNKEVFQKACRIPWDNVETTNNKIKFLSQTWNKISKKLQEKPQYERFKETFFFDLKTCFEAMNYTRVVNKNPEMFNQTELKTHDKYGMPLFLFVDIDLMHHTHIEESEIRQIRSTVDELTYIVRVGNWITTWEREIQENDLISGVVGKALQENIITYEEMKQLDSEALINKINNSGIETEMEQSWKANYDSINSKAPQLETFNLKSLVTGVGEVMTHYELRPTKNINKSQK